jgi:hypothetical protein
VSMKVWMVRRTMGEDIVKYKGAKRIMIALK